MEPIKTELPTFDKLMEMRNQDQAKIVWSANEGTCFLWEVEGNPEFYVTLPDNSVITQKQDNESGAEFAIFPYNQ